MVRRNLALEPALGTLLLSLFWGAQAHAGKLSDVREQTGASNGHASQSDRDDNDEHNGDNDETALGTLLLQLLSGGDSHRESSHSASSSGGEPSRLELALFHPWFYPLYPYRGNAPGNLARRHFNIAKPVPSGCDNLDRNCHRSQRVVACVDANCYSDALISDAPASSGSALVEQVQSARGQLQLDAGTTLDGLWRGTVAASVDSHRGLGVESKLTYWIERQPGEATDSTLIGDANVRWSLVNRPALQLRLGAGPRFQVDAISKSAGVNLTLGAELYPLEPVVVRLDADAGNLGGAFVYETQASIGLLVRRVEILAGMSSLHVGDVAFDSAFAGLRFHM